MVSSLSANLSVLSGRLLKALSGTVLMALLDRSSCRSELRRRSAWTGTSVSWLSGKLRLARLFSSPCNALSDTCLS
uniref:Uncharacterized protein n=1 Tax=Ixodes ricinus TaxID=34613 RepID=A0A6B0U5B7_IXORI